MLNLTEPKSDMKIMLKATSGRYLTLIILEQHLTNIFLGTTFKSG